MPPPVFLDPGTLDLDQIIADRETIQRHNPQRYEFALLDAVIYRDAENHIYAGYHDVRADAWWTRAHIPGRPLMPGVLMLETAAQLASYMVHQVFESDDFLGFAGADGVKFRGTVEPPCRLVMIGKGRQVKPRRIICDTQGFVDGVMVFEATIRGIFV